MLFCQFMIRTANFVKSFNGYKGSRLVLADFFTVDEILNFKHNYLQENGHPIRSIGTYAEGSYGDGDVVEGNAYPRQIR